jgi:hypothetical protein
MKRVSDAQYKKGFEDGQKSNNNPQIVISNHKQQTPLFIDRNKKSELTLEDLD